MQTSGTKSLEAYSFHVWIKEWYLKGWKYTYTWNDIMVHWDIYVLNAVMIIHNLIIYHKVVFNK